ncbi:helix-turn-helix transcriptional regulator [Actinokineospora sp. UTMC 2448]|uniref:helix-turn-helix domain-containing protein n=1 Tax=Actinokineospora sp. UTMC 2448 TaxID=2268449 RepID=UPI002164B8D2|nr:helix-turn-helix transcriptional regulator [Actinokineospora sp. UTMC 2448]UVS81013.1 hypothetical protein Actkin_04765 [Actinokineospora sp. UTMC 2448]
MTAIQTSARRRELGDELRTAREAAGVSGMKLAAMLGWSNSKLSRVERGLNRCTGTEAAILLGYLRAKPETVERIVRLCEDDRPGPWVQPASNRVSDQLRTLIMHETTATLIYCLEINRVPGLLQTEEYARSMIRGTGLVPEDGIEPRVAGRLARQSLVRGPDSPTFVFYLHEHALRLPIGGPAAMHEQLLKLLLTSSQDGCAVRVIPESLGPHAGMGGPFTYMQFADHDPVVYVETQNRCLFLEQPGDIASYRLVLGKLGEQALSARDSRFILSEYADYYDKLEAGNGD